MAGRGGTSGVRTLFLTLRSAPHLVTVTHCPGQLGGPLGPRGSPWWSTAHPMGTEGCHRPGLWVPCDHSRSRGRGGGALGTTAAMRSGPDSETPCGRPWWGVLQAVGVRVLVKRLTGASGLLLAASTFSPLVTSFSDTDKTFPTDPDGSQHLCPFKT